MKKIDFPKIVIAAVIKKNNQILLGKRKSKYANGFWGFPGGKLDSGENIFNCAKREVLEETGIKIKNLKTSLFTEVFFKKQKAHFIVLFILAEHKSGKEKLIEPNKCEKWEWFSKSTLPKKLSPPLKFFLKKNPLFLK